MTNANLLPAGFASLEPYVLAWALPSELARRDKRVSSSMQEHKQFYDEVMKNWPQIASVLKSSPPYQLEPKIERLMHLAMSAMESGAVIETLGTQNSPLAIDHRRLTYLCEA